MTRKEFFGGGKTLHGFDAVKRHDREIIEERKWTTVNMTTPNQRPRKYLVFVRLRLSMTF